MCIREPRLLLFPHLLINKLITKQLLLHLSLPLLHTGAHGAAPTTIIWLNLLSLGLGGLQGIGAGVTGLALDKI